MKTKTKLIAVNIISFFVIAMFSAIVVPKAIAGDIQLPSKETQSDEMRPATRQMNKPLPKPKQESPQEPVPILNPCTACQVRRVNFKGDSFDSYCHGTCIRDGYCEE